MSSTYDIVIVGAGIAGASLAAALAGHARVLLLEREVRPAMHATGRSAAMFHLTYGGPRLQPLSAATLDLFHRLDPAFWPGPVLSPRGILLFADAASAPTLAHEITASNGAYGAITVDEAVRLLPLLRRDRIVAAAYDGDGFDIDVDALQAGFLRQFAACGGRLQCSAELAAITRNDGIWHLTVAGQHIETPILVNAAGAWGDELARLAGVRPIGLQPKRRTAALIDAPPDSAGWPMSIEAAETFYIKPDAGRLLLSPAEETDVEPHDAAADDYALAQGAERMAWYLDWEVRRKPVAWAGLRTFSPDRAPVIGFDPDADGFFWLVGQGGYGVQTSAAVAQLAAALITGQPGIVPPGVEAAIYDPSRFGR